MLLAGNPLKRSIIAMTRRPTFGSYGLMRLGMMLGFADGNPPLFGTVLG
jgi:hypothetical protein